MPYNYGPYYGPPQGPWIPPQGAPPGYLQQSPGEGPVAKGFSNLGTWSLVLGILELLFCFYKLVSAALSSSIMAMNRSLLGAAPTPPPAPLSGMMASVEEFTSKIALWEAIRALPFAIASGFLIGLAVRLRRGDRSALFAARIWVWFALGVIVLSVGLQLFVIFPLTLEYTRRLTSAMSSASTVGGKPVFDFGGVMDTMTLVSTGISLIVNTLFFAIWPVVLRLWADRLIRETTPQVS
jgi:hypothetical protein